MTDERSGEFLDELRPVIDFMRQQYWYVYDPADRQRMLAAIATVNRGVAEPDRAERDGAEPVPPAGSVVAAD